MEDEEVALEWWGCGAEQNVVPCWVCVQRDAAMRHKMQAKQSPLVTTSTANHRAARVAVYCVR